VQETEEEHFRMQELQQQEQDITGAHSIRSQAAIPGTSRDEYCNKTVHQESQRRKMMREGQTVTSEFRDDPGRFNSVIDPCNSFMRLVE
jgi:hypothetical protein